MQETTEDQRTHASAAKLVRLLAADDAAARSLLEAGTTECGYHRTLSLGRPSGHLIRIKTSEWLVDHDGSVAVVGDTELEWISPLDITGAQPCGDIFATVQRKNGARFAMLKDDFAQLFA